VDLHGDATALDNLITDPGTAAELQKQGPVHRATSPTGMPVCLVVGYDEATAALSDRRLSVAASHAAGALDGGKLSPDLRDALLKSLTNSDPPDHTRLRRLVSSAFTVRQVEAMRPWIGRLIDDLIDRFEPNGRVELMDDTTLSLIGNGVYLLLTKSERAARLRAEPGLLPAAIEEFLRLESPVPTANFRVALESFEIGGTRIAAGDMVLISLQSANRDLSKFPDPAGLDPARAQRRHLAFGHGIHFCLGAPLARIEAEQAIGTLLNRFPQLRLAVPPAELTWSQAMFVHRLDTLPLLLS